MPESGGSYLGTAYGTKQAGRSAKRSGQGFCTLQRIPYLSIKYYKKIAKIERADEFRSFYFAVFF